MKREGPDSQSGLDVSGVDRDVVVIQAQGGSTQELPAGAWVLGADFIRQGPGLLLVGADGQQILIRDFF